MPPTTPTITVFLDESYPDGWEADRLPDASDLAEQPGIASVEPSPQGYRAIVTGTRQHLGWLIGFVRDDRGRPWEVYREEDVRICPWKHRPEVAVLPAKGTYVGKHVAVGLALERDA